MSLFSAEVLPVLGISSTDLEETQVENEVPEEANPENQ